MSLGFPLRHRNHQLHLTCAVDHFEHYRLIQLQVFLLPYPLHIPLRFQITSYLYFGALHCTARLLIQSLINLHECTYDSLTLASQEESLLQVEITLSSFLLQRLMYM